MSKTLGGYGRYKDDPGYVGCPRATSDMTPCVARDGHLAVADIGVCVGCGGRPRLLLRDLEEAMADQRGAADFLRDLVRWVTEPPQTPPDAASAPLSDEEPEGGGLGHE